MTDDRRLLERYLACRDEDAFRELVRRHVDLVHGVARRLTGNDEMARDAAQNAFVKLARDAARFPGGVSVPAWLHRTTRSLAIDLVRAETRRQRREAAARQHHVAMTTTEPEWERLAPVIDEAVDALPAADREVVLAKYYRNESFAGIAARHGWTEVNARKRASRALEKLRRLLSRRGLVTTASALATILPAHAAPPAPASLTAAIFTATATATADAAPAAGLTLAMTALQKSTVAAAAVLVLLGSGWIGHAVGSSSRELPPETMRITTVNATRDSGGVRSARSRTSRDGEDPVEAFRELIAGRRPDAWPVVSRLPVDLIPGLLEELHGSWRELPQTSSQAAWLVEIESALLGRWAESDPRAAFDHVKRMIATYPREESSRMPYLLEVVVGTWMQTDPEAATDAAMAGGHTDYQMTAAVVRNWSPETLERNLARHPSCRDALLGVYCAEAGKSGGPVRDALLERLRDDPAWPERDLVRRELFRGWGHADFHAALQRAGELGLTGTVDALLEDAVGINPAEGMPAAVERGKAPAADRWKHGYAYWIHLDEPAAREWFRRTEEVWASQGHHQAVADFLAAELGHLREQLSTDAAAQQSVTGRLEKSLSRWRAADPVAAGKWAGGNAAKLGLDLSPQ